MSSTKLVLEPSRRELRSFGFTVAVGFLLAGVWPALFRGQRVRVWAIAIGLVFAPAGVLVPSGLRSIRRVWMAFGNILGRINTGLILGAVYYGMLTPVRLLMKAAGRDPMNRSFDPGCASYRSVRKPRQASHMKNQF
jgi:hypothetical protein